MQLLRNRPAPIPPAGAEPTGAEVQISASALAVLRWLSANRVEHVLVGGVARSLCGDPEAAGPVAIVAAPYGRNLDRLARALSAAHARLRTDPRPSGGLGGSLAVQSPLARLTPEQLLRVERFALRCGDHDLDIEGHPHGAPSYQELLYEASRLDVVAELAVEVAAPQDIELYEHVRRTGVVPEIRVRRAAPEGGRTA